MLDDPGGRNRGSEVGWKSCVSWRDGVSVDGDKALVGLGHSHGCPGCDGSHLAWGGHSLGWVEVPCSCSGSGVARVAEVAHRAGAERGGLGGGVASTTRGRAGAGVGGHPLPGSQAGVDVLEARSTRWSLLPAFGHQTIKPERQQRKSVTREHKAGL